jgi:uncharacterized protein YyaL (SSP411 family)
MPLLSSAGQKELLLTDAPAGTPRHTNLLADESSPYLLQHAHNPVDWFPWGPEAFEKARKEDKPIFLSVGYSTCYWCHVMERESFESEAVAAEMNRLFVCIKVDREERPDVDQLYMTAVQLITRHGGWPMSVWLTPDLRPFYGGTYFPQANFLAYLRGLDDAYRNRSDEVQKSADQITSILRRLARPGAPDKPLKVDDALIESLIDRSVSDYDPHQGGFGGAPKFPRETLLELLLVYLDSPTANSAVRNPQSAILKQLRHTLDAMADGGIRDQLGGGFHRYSTDAQWLVPHFEIMLYDNAMLGWVYSEAYRQTKERRYAQVARGIFDFILREMTSPQGAFYTAFDAEVDAQEGLSYLWTKAEVDAVLGEQDAKLFNRVYGVDQGPNFADPHHGTGRPDKSILYLPRPMSVVAAELKLDVDQLEERLAPLRKRLYDVRLKRKQPLLDTKIITSWNALMIRALAHGGKILDEPRYIDAASRAAEFILHSHLTDGTLSRTSRDGKPKHHGFLDDYAFLAQALLALHDATDDPKWTRHAADVAKAMTRKFADDEGGGFFFTDAEATDLIVRQKTAQDSPLPSGNAVAVMALLELGQGEASQRTLAAFAQQMADQGESMSSMVEAALVYLRRAEPFTVSASPAGSAVDRPASPQQIAAGVVSVKAEWMSAAELHLILGVLDGFHINAHETGGEIPLIATRLNVESPGATVEYPPGEERSFAFSTQPIRVYSGEVILLVRFDPPATPDLRVRLSLSYQACDESSCFPPVTKPIELEVPSVH